MECTERAELDNAGLSSAEAATDALLPEVSDCLTLARYLHVDLKTVQGLAQRGEIPCRKVGKAYRFFRPAVLSWLCEPKPSSHGRQR
jgi:excisionase family DNA binding protein